MATDNNSLKWPHFSSKPENFPIWSIRFIAFMQTKGLYKTPIGHEDKIRRPDNLPENHSDEQRVTRDAQQKEYTIKVEEKENRNNIVW